MPKTRRTPIWLSIATALRTDLSEGRYKTGDKLPTEAVLADRFGVNRHTVRHALTQLVDDGLIYTRRGAGAFVAATPTAYPIGKRVRFHENLRAAGRHPSKRMLALETRAATAGEAEALEIAKGGRILAYFGLSFGDGQPIALAEAVFPLERLKGLDHALSATTSISQALKDVGVADYARRETRLTAVAADATQALHLQLREGDPLIRTSSLSVDPAGEPVELGRTWFAGDRVTLTVDA